MSDWEISADTQAHLVAVVQQVMANRRANIGITGRDGFVIEGFLQNGTRFCVDYYKTKSVPTGKTVAGVNGQQVPEMATVAGVFGILRWLSPTNTDPPQPAAASGVKLVPLPADSPRRFFG
jgi:hypothetical protein